MSRALTRIRAWPPAWADAGLAACFVLFGQIEAWTAHTSGHVGSVSTSGTLSRPLAALTYFVLCAAVAFRRRWPLVAALVPIAALCVLRVVGGGLLVEATAPLIAIALLMYTVGAQETTRWSLAGLGGAIALMWTYVAIDASNAGDLLFTALLAGGPWGLGRLIRGRREQIEEYRLLAEQLDAAREEQARAAAVSERVRIARELHDLIGHSLSVMVVQANGARRVIGSDRQRAGAVLAAVENIGHDTLSELRRLLGMMGNDAGQEPPLSPQPGLAGLKTLIARARDAGMPTELLVEGDPVALAPGLDLSAYRILQEALTNSIKHASPARARVTMRWRRDCLELEVRDDGHHRGAGMPNTCGHGLIGMQERVALFGGSLHAGTLPRRGFVVKASLPLEQMESA